MDSGDPIALLKNTDSMATWSEDKRKDFVQLFNNRAEIALILCKMTASKIANMASARHFISNFHLAKIQRSHGWSPDGEYKYEYSDSIRSCGRNYEEIARIADDRAKSLLSELPPLKKAVQVIDPDTAQMLVDIERLTKKAEKAKAELESLPRQIDLADVDQKMSIKDFRKEVTALIKKRKRLLESMNEAGNEAHNLEISVAKRLYKGFPGLSDAVMDVIVAHVERAVALDQMQRRVGEHVMFGDSDAATSLLSQFEKDEAEVSDELKTKLNASMAALKASVKALPKKKKAGAKALPAKKKATKGRK
jgi:hypothetical protein